MLVAVSRAIMNLPFRHSSSSLSIISSKADHRNSRFRNFCALLLIWKVFEDFHIYALHCLSWSQCM